MTSALFRLEAHYRGCGWKVQSRDGHTVRATGPGGVTWIGMAVVGDDLADHATEQRLLDLSDERMEGGRIVCPFELLPAAACADELRSTLLAHAFALGIQHRVLGLCIDVLYALAAGAVGTWLRTRPDVLRRQRFLTGGVYLALGAVAALSGDHRRKT